MNKHCKRNTFIIGTRASTLALVQTEMVLAKLAAAHPGVSFEVRHIRTNGDHDQQTPLATLGGLGIFIKEIENALLAGEIDLAVHSLKDMPTIQPEGLTLGAVLVREDARDALVCPRGLALSELPPGARVGTGSLRREAQLRALRPDLTILGLRGNVDTRLRKVAAGEYDAIVLALAGLIRLGREAEVTAVLPVDIMLPAVGQGAIAVEVRAADGAARELVSVLNHPPTQVATAAERSFLRELGGGCHVPIAAHATVDGAELWLRGLVASVTGERVERGNISGPAAQAEALGRDLARQLLRQGCAELLAEEGTRA